jgi:predicted transcriptional regulator
MLADPVVASAIVERLLHNATVINIKGHSYRMRRYNAAQQAKGCTVVACPRAVHVRAQLCAPFVPAYSPTPLPDALHCSRDIPGAPTTGVDIT